MCGGRTGVRDLIGDSNLSPESEAYTTVGGFLMTEAGHVLKPGEVVKYNGLQFQIDRVEKRRVMRVKLEIMEKTNHDHRSSVAANQSS
jgi:CBS domain containing-hemolysin-like protein